MSSIEKEYAETELLVRDILNSDPRARNDDLWLILQIWQKKQNIKLFVPYDKIKEMISPETIRRTRQHVQNDKKLFLPTDPKVLRARRFKEEAVRKYFGDFHPVYREYMYEVYKIK